jgi:HNH endonuclease
MRNKSIKKAVFERANSLCEYCYSQMGFSTQSFEIEHITPTSKGGTDDLENLACACGGCNAHKSNKTHAKDAFTGLIVPLFHPRLMIWNEHFTWSDDFLKIIALTDIGRATISTLHLNRSGLVNMRKLLFLNGLHPPK